MLIINIAFVKLLLSRFIIKPHLQHATGKTFLSLRL
jgi:hypothetical protein